MTLVKTHTETTEGVPFKRLTVGEMFILTDDCKKEHYRVYCKTGRHSYRETGISEDGTRYSTKIKINPKRRVTKVIVRFVLE